jgi:predicted alpha-1,2-mannosidase
MRGKIVLIIILISFKILAQKTPADFVNPMIGTQNGGNTFPGASLPFGMVKLGPDSYNKWSNSGYEYQVPIGGFSHTHVSGTGGGPKYGNVLFMPSSKSGSKTIDTRSFALSVANETAKTGYYSALLKGDSIRAELTSTHSVGLHRYSFFKKGNRNVLIDLGSCLGKYLNEGKQELVDCEIEVTGSNTIEGYTRVRGGWNNGQAYTVYFYAEFNTHFASAQLWQDTVLLANSKHLSSYGKDAGALVSFDKSVDEVVVKVGISFRSRAKARENVEKEVPDFNFESYRNKAFEQWNSYLSKVKVESKDSNKLVMFYSALYHMLLMPENRTGENPLWNSDKPYYDDFYAIWDTYRATSPFVSLVWPSKQVEIINAMLDIYTQEGFMPDSRSGNYNGLTQGGSNCDVVIADAMVKSLPGIDYNLGLNAMLKNAEVDPGCNYWKEGRGSNDIYKKLGYLPSNIQRAGSRTVEYSYNDFCISEVARLLKKDSLSKVYLARSKSWQNLWNPNATHQGFTGFIWPRKEDGSWDMSHKNVINFSREEIWDKFSPISAGSWYDFFYESHSWEYSFYAPHDIPKLIELCGGNNRFAERLDTLFAKHYYNIWNEPGFMIPSLYNFVGKQYRTAAVVKMLIEKYYKNSPTGLPGNDDSGSMSAWYAFHALGFFPVAGQDYYIVTTPQFEKTQIRLENGKLLTIIAEGVNDTNFYIQSLSLNGKKITSPFLKHSELMEGGELKFIMGAKPSTFLK